MKITRLGGLVVGWCAVWSLCRGEEAQILVQADQITHRLSRYLTGACIEDVNHEIYGGLYSQMIFGESFQEPASAQGPEGFTAYGGRWESKDGALWAAAGDGPKLISEGTELSGGEVRIELLLPDQAEGNAGLILKVRESGVGADKFTGYEISLESAGFLVLGRHRQNWEPLRRVRCDVPTNHWNNLAVRMSENSLEVLLNGQSIVTYRDSEHPLPRGRVGLRTWRREARFRNLEIRSEGHTRKLTFDERPDAPLGAVSGMWRAFWHGSARGEFSLEASQPFTGRQSQSLTFKSGMGEVGIENQSLNRWGMHFVAGKPYEGYLWLRDTTAAETRPPKVHVALESANGAGVYAEGAFEVKSRQWQRVDFKLTPSASDTAGRFAIKLKEPGSVGIGYVFLGPGSWGRFKGLPVRRDISEALIAQGLTVLRYGGSMINASEYRWKKMIGPPARRPPYHGTWYAQSSNGWGIFDFLNFCEAAGFLGIPAINMDESPQDMADFFEYANGSRKSAWGARRAQDEHPRPYHLKYLELGNEEAIDEAYWQKFKPLAEAIWSKDPQVILVVGDFAYDQLITDPYNFSGAPNIKTLAVHKKILELARQHDREVWFDVHINTENPPEPRGLPGVRSFSEQLAKLAPGARYKVAVFEFNAGNHAMKRALANACAINQLERLGDRIAIACSANCLQPYRQNDNGWNQGLLFLSPSQVWAQPPYYVTRMMARNFQPLCLKTQVLGAEDALDVTATKSEDGKTLVLQVVNVSRANCAARVELKGFVPKASAVRVTEVVGGWEEVNTPEDPGRIKPVEKLWRYAVSQGSLSCTVPSNSVTVLRFR